MKDEEEKRGYKIDKKMKKKIISANILFIIPILIIIIILVLPMKFISNYVHESGHIKEAEKQNISLKMKPFSYEKSNFIKTFGNAKSIPVSKEDCEKFNSLEIENKNKITHAGVKYEAGFTIIFIFIILMICYKYRINIMNRNVFAVILLLLVFLLVSIWGNVLSSNPNNDWHKLFMDCSVF